MKNTYQEELFNKLLNHQRWKNEIESVSKVIGTATWVLISKNGKFYTFTDDEDRAKKATKTTTPDISNTLFRAKKTHKTEKIICNDGSYTYCIPIIRDNISYGYIAISKLNSKISPEFLELLNSYTCTTIESIQKELELSKLYETIKPKLG